MTTVAIYQPRPFPQLHYFNRLLQSDVFVLYDDAQFKRQSWQHRFEIIQGNKKILVTIPINRNDLFKPISQVRVSDEVRWRKKLMKTLYYNYSTHPFWKQYKGIIKKCLKMKKLIDMSSYFITFVLARLDIETRVTSSSFLILKNLSGTDRLIEICKKLRADEYLCGETAYNSYMDIDKFKDAEIDVRVQKWECDYEYGNISILDPLMRLGGQTKQWIM